MKKADQSEAEQFVHLVKRAKPDELVDRLVSLTDAERRTYAKAVAKAWRKTHPDRWSERDFRLDLALVGVCSWTDAKRFRMMPNFRRRHDDVQDLVFEVLVARRPDWIDRWVERELDGEDWTIDWPFIRSLVREGVCSTPETDEYIVHMVTWRIGAWRDKTPLVDALRADPGLLENELWRAFEVDPQNGNLFYDDEAGWRQENQGQSWGLALVELAADGTIDRRRLIHASLGTLRCGIQLKGTAFHTKLHDRLDPTPAEKSELAEVYLDLLNHPVDAVVKFGIRQIDDLIKSGKIGADSVLDRIPFALQRETKGPAVTALKTLRRLVKADATVAERAAIAATTGLTHSRADVQEKTLELIEGVLKGSSSSTAETLREYLEYVAPSQRGRLEQLISRLDPLQKKTAECSFENDIGATASAAQNGSAEITEIVERVRSIDPDALEISGLGGLLAAFESGGLPARISPAYDKIPRLDPSDEVKPIETLDELIDTLLALLENAEDTIEVERALDGLTRLTATRPKDLGERTASLLKRAREPGGPMSDYSALAHSVAALVRSWLQGSPVLAREIQRAPGPEAFIIARFGEIERRLRSKAARGLLAFPTHRGPWIDPRVLVDRVRSDAGTPHEDNALDMMQALLRLAPDHRQKAHSDAADLIGEYGAVLRFALGGDGPAIPEQNKRGWLASALEKLSAQKPSNEHQWALWICAARARDPFGIVDELVSTPVEAEAFAVKRPAYEWQITKPKRGSWDSDPSIRVLGEPAIPPAAPTDRPLAALCTRGSPWSVADARARCSIWPMDPEPVSIGGCTAMCGRLFRPAAALSPTATFLEPLFDPHAPFAEMSNVMLCLALIAQDADARTMGLDAAHTVIADGRSDGADLGRMLGRLNETRGLVKLNRIGKAVEQIMVHGPLHQLACNRLLEELLTTFDAPPRDLHHLLSPYRETLVATGNTADSQTRTLLSKISGSGKTARLARLILNDPGDAQLVHNTSQAAWAELLETRGETTETVADRLKPT